MERFCECAVEGVEVNQCARWDSVEWQNASVPVQIHCHSAGAKRALHRYDDPLVFVTGYETIVAHQTPGRIILTDPTVIILPFSFDSLVGYTNIHPAFPVHLPITAPSQPLFTQHLLPVTKSLCMVWVWQFLLHHCHTSVVFRQSEIAVCSISVQREFASIWGQKINVCFFYLFIFRSLNVLIVQNQWKR